MILWIKGIATPVEVVKIQNDQLLVQLCGDGEKRVINLEDIVGIEILNRIDLFFQIKRVQITE